jgi:hypothetical protein
MAEHYFPEADISELAQLIHGTLSSSAARGAGAGFDDAGRPLRLAAWPG